MRSLIVLALGCGLLGLAGCSSGATGAFPVVGGARAADGGAHDDAATAAAGQNAIMESDSGEDEGAAPGDASTCSAGDLVTQRECGEGFACDVARHALGGDAGAATDSGVGGETLVCRAAKAGATEGSACTAGNPSTCASGTTCGEPDDGSTVAACYRFCAQDSDCTAPGGICATTTLETGGGEGFTARLCTFDCDPLAQKGCGAKQACSVSLASTESRLYTSCVAAGAGGYQAPCGKPEDCLAGFSCVHASVGGGPEEQICLQLCEVGADAGAATGACPATQACQPVAKPNTLGKTEVGWCF